MSEFSDAVLARRIEALSAAELLRFVETSRADDSCSEAAALEVAGGVAIYIGPSSPVNQAVGIGLDGRVTDEDIESLETFYAERGQRAFVILAPHVDHTLISVLAARGWTLDGFENVLVRPYVGEEIFPAAPAGVDVREVTDDEGRSLWGHVAATGFSAPLDPLPAQIELARLVTLRRGSRLFLALVDGRPAGTGELFVDGGVAWLSADSTLPGMRRRGVQTAVQLARLREGALAGCDLAVSEAAPGSTSQRNMERHGFRVAYTRAELIAPALS